MSHPHQNMRSESSSQITIPVAEHEGLASQEEAVGVQRGKVVHALILTNGDLSRRTSPVGLWTEPTRDDLWTPSGHPLMW